MRLGMLPIDPATNNYSAEMVEKFDNLIAPQEYNWKLEDILPKVLSAGENAGVLTPEGSRKLRRIRSFEGRNTGLSAGRRCRYRHGCNQCSQGMRTGNVLGRYFLILHDRIGERVAQNPTEMIDMVTTPDGSLVAMVHCNNNCTSDLNAWVNLFKEYQELLGIPVNMDEI